MYVGKAVRRLARLVRRSRLSEGKPEWCEVERGPLVGLRFLLPPDAHMRKMLTGEYEPRVLEALARLAARGGTLYDAGAHTGYYTCAWLRLGGSTVEAFEPLPWNAAILRETLARNNMAGVARVHELALGDQSGVAALVASERNVGASSAAYVEGVGGVEWMLGQGKYPEGARRHTVRIETLDGLLDSGSVGPPSAIKIDVEGAEARVLSGNARLLATYRPAVLCEVHNTGAGVRVAEQMARLGYTLTVLDEGAFGAHCLWLAQPS